MNAGRLRYELDRQAYRCLFSGRGMDVHSAVLLDGSRTPRKTSVVMHSDVWDSLPENILYVTGWSGSEITDGRDT